MNVGGLNSAWKQFHLLNIMFTDIDLVAISETLVSNRQDHF